MKSEILNKLYREYDIANLSYGTINDKLGDVYEDYVMRVITDNNNIDAYNNNSWIDTLEYKVFEGIMNKLEIICNNEHYITYIEATNSIPHRATGGMPKTDVIITIIFNDNNRIEIPWSVKQSSVDKVAMAEFDVDTICREVGITDRRLKELMLKHQRDCSAKNFSVEEKKELTYLLRPYSKQFVRWVISGSIDEFPCDIVYPRYIIKFKLNKPLNRYDIRLDKGDYELKSYEILTVDECVDKIMLTKYGTIKQGGFGTGLGWTYATGSKGTKMQFKG